MTATARRLPPASHGEEVPMLPWNAVAHGLARVRGRRAPARDDGTDAALLMADLHERGWTVVATPEWGAAAPRTAALAACLAVAAAGPALGAAQKPTPRMEADADALLGHLRSLCFDLAPREAGAA
jgi:aryl-alcohol dehydrogenase-like predicted oxidoreductase